MREKPRYPRARSKTSENVEWRWNKKKKWKKENVKRKVFAITLHTLQLLLCHTLSLTFSRFSHLTDNLFQWNALNLLQGWTPSHVGFSLRDDIWMDFPQFKGCWMSEIIFGNGNNNSSIKSFWTRERFWWESHNMTGIHQIIAFPPTPSISTLSNTEWMNGSSKRKKHSRAECVLGCPVLCWGIIPVLPIRSTKRDGQPSPNSKWKRNENYYYYYGFGSDYSDLVVDNDNNGFNTASNYTPTPPPIV